MMSKNRPLAGPLAALGGKLLLIWLLSFLLLFFESYVIGSNNDHIPILQYEIIDIFPHDSESFTQGLVWKDGFLYEGTGLYGQSSLRKVEPGTGIILHQRNLPDNFFGEGITIFKDRIYQLTWKEQTGFICDLETFQLLETFSYGYEGWGITHDGEYLIISDGTNVLRFLDPFTLRKIKQIEVHERQNNVDQINELEYIKGYIYANIWQTDRIAIIDPETGKVSAWLDLSGILNQKDMNQKIDVLNGIAYDAKNDHLFITGKLWPKMFKIRVIDRD
ncbi:MAG: glutaminyl-peptide cyclotransferase [Atribacterota bacterium]